MKKLSHWGFRFPKAILKYKYFFYVSLFGTARVI